MDAPGLARAEELSRQRRHSPFHISKSIALIFPPIVAVLTSEGARSSWISYLLRGLSAFGCASSPDRAGLKNLHRTISGVSA